MHRQWAKGSLKNKLPLFLGVPQIKEGNMKIERIAVCCCMILIYLILPSKAFPIQNPGMDSKVLLKHHQSWTGDYDQMVERRVIRVLVPYSKTFFFFDGPKPKGLTYEGLKAFEKMINGTIDSGHLKCHVIVIPTSRDTLITSLTEGKGDIAAGNLTATENRSKQVDFSQPFFSGVSEIIVTGPKSPAINIVSDLAGKTVYIRPSSSYHESLMLLNQKLSGQGRDPVQIIQANEYLEDEDLLEMLNAGLIPMMVIDDHKGRFWAQVFKNITLHPDIKLREDGEICWAFRKNSPKLEKVINTFVQKTKREFDGKHPVQAVFEKYEVY